MGALKEPVADLYEDDFYAWTVDQVYKLKRREFDRLDLDNLIEEIESLGRSQRSELKSRLAQLLMHLLKWEHQSLQRARSWELTITEQRRQIDILFDEMPSLRPQVPGAVRDAYSRARLLAERETGMTIATFPVDCPYAIDDVMNPDWLPKVEDGWPSWQKPAADD